MNAPLAWTDDRVAALRKLYAGGMSASRIALELGGGVTRNAVIGKVHRLGLKPDVPRIPRGGGGRPKREHQERRVAAAARDPWKRRAPVAPVAPPPINSPEPVRADPLPPGGTALLDLRDTHCRWPSGDGADVRFCGQPRVESEVNGMLCPYCAGHARMAYAPAIKRQRSEAAKHGDFKRSFAKQGMAWGSAG